MVQVRGVVLAHDSRLLREMLKHVIDKTPGLEVVDEVADLSRLLSAVERSHSQWAIVSLHADGTMPNVTDRVLQECSFVRMLGLTTDGTITKVKRVASSGRILGHLSLREFLAVLEDDDVRVT